MTPTTAMTPTRTIKAVPVSNAPGIVSSTSRQVVMVVEIHDPDPDKVEADDFWVVTFGAALIDVRRTVESFGGELMAVLGTRVVSAFPSERVTAALDAAVNLQRRAALGAGSQRGWLCSVGIGTGEPLGGEVVNALGVPIFGKVIDKALLLCSLAPAGAIFADEPSVMPALFETGGDRGDPNKGCIWSLGAFRVLAVRDNDTVEFWEVLFDRNGSSELPPLSGAVSLLVNSRESKTRRPSGGDPNSGAPADREAALHTRRVWTLGTVCCWFGAQGRGVIASESGQEFYVDRRFLVTGTELPCDAKVFFVPRDPISKGRNPVAGAVLLEATPFEVRVEHVDGRGSGFAEIADGQGTKQLVMLDLSESQVLRRGDRLLVRVRRHKRLPLAVPV